MFVNQATFSYGEKCRTFHIRISMLNTIQQTLHQSFLVRHIPISSLCLLDLPVQLDLLQGVGLHLPFVVPGLALYGLLNLGTSFQTA